ncbi:phosphotransferase system glucose/maltose/N-acetylglucosamine-specific IIC component [Oikeobacillus pervagus]|uniref:Phosphotransferase system glucose/maltose/N-acetylglucosamine-specific IIC component n=1 Tax=Oikeobacillus pervagus TaxID=1325931 RepID=A0AAJ1WM06_9BACI|nr:phosphotransferase system glucose/maltose/N-acetylglucosamine-specific IIC component [Oikeobacillus pervagus]
MLLQHFVLLFLYFPEDKSEYIPAAISMAIFLVFAVLTFMFIKKISKKEEKKTEELEKQWKKQNESNKHS